MLMFLIEFAFFCKPLIRTVPTFYFDDLAAVLCCDNTVVQVWLGLVTQLTRLDEEEEDHLA